MHFNSIFLKCTVQRVNDFNSFYIGDGGDGAKEVMKCNIRSIPSPSFPPKMLLTGVFYLVYKKHSISIPQVKARIKLSSHYLLVFVFLQHAVKIELGRVRFLFDKHRWFTHGHNPSQTSYSLTYTRQVVEILATAVLVSISLQTRVSQGASF